MKSVLIPHIVCATLLLGFDLLLNATVLSRSSWPSPWYLSRTNSFLSLTLLWHQVTPICQTTKPHHSITISPAHRLTHFRTVITSTALRVVNLQRTLNAISKRPPLIYRHRVHLLSCLTFCTVTFGLLPSVFLRFPDIYPSFWVCKCFCKVCFGLWILLSSLAIYIHDSHFFLNVISLDARICNE